MKCKECKYCVSGGKERKFLTKMSHLVARIYDNNLYVQSYYGDYEVKTTLLPINYCPMCGRKLDD